MDATTGDDDNSPSASLWDDVGYIARVTAARLAHSMTIVDLCRRTGHSPAYFRARPGKSRQTSEILMVAEVLEVHPGYLMGFEGYRDPGAISRSRNFADVTAHLFCAIARSERDVSPDEIVALLQTLLKKHPPFKEQDENP
jgi:hypothetical protein